MTPGSNRPGPELTPESRRRLRRAALLRPMALLMVGIGAFFFLATRESWVVPLTLATYAALVLLAIGDPIFQNRVLGTTQQGRRIPQAPQRPNSPPEQRTRRRRDVPASLLGLLLASAGIVPAGLDIIDHSCEYS